MIKKYDRAYFEHWYRGENICGRAVLARKAAMAVAMAEHYLGRTIRTVLDVGCGEAPWRAPLLKLRPKLRYQGVDSSEYVVAKYGRSRNIALAGFGQLAELRFGAPVDLLVCSDVMHYVPTPELKRGLSGFGELCGGLAFIEVFTSEDAIVGDLEGFIWRSPSIYRRLIAAAGLLACGSHAYLSPSLRDGATALETAV